MNPTGGSSLEQFLGDGYSNVHQTGEGLRRLRGDWERYRRGESEVVATREEPLPASVRKGLVLLGWGRVLKPTGRLPLGFVDQMAIEEAQ